MRRKNAVYSSNEIEGKTRMNRICSTLLMVLRLGVKSCVIIFVRFFMLVLLSPFILTYLIAVPIMILSPVILMVMGFVNGFHTIGIAELVEVLKGVVLGSFLAIIGYYIGKFAVKRLNEKRKWTISILNKEKMI
nr:DUF1700 domain-containing protein [Shouchella patagoniensis]